MNKPRENVYKLRILKISTLLIVAVVVVEVSLGLLASSLSILSDGLHACLDTVTGVILFFATKAAAKPPDEEHLYGHEKFEPVGGLISGISLFGVALLVEYEATSKLLQGTGVNQSLELAGFFAIGFTFLVDIARISIFRKSRLIQSATVKAGFYDSIADLSSTIVALAGFSLAAIAGFYWGDALGSILLGVLLGYLSVRLAQKSITELSDTASKDLVARVKQEIQSQTGTLRTQNLRTRRVGSKVFVETALQVPNSMSLEEAHGLASKVEARLAQAFGEVEVTIHIEPVEKDSGLALLVRQLANVDGVSDVHEVSTTYVGGKLYIALHVHVDPAMTVKESHAIAERIEQNMRANIRQLENVTVHMGPQDEEHPLKASDEELKVSISQIVRGVDSSLQMRRIVTYRAGGKLYVSIDCGFSEQESIAIAHDLASEVENAVQARIPNSVVTVHLEPAVSEKD
jgi:cation diffusion facilitator family transporter